MKINKLNVGETVEVGDILRHENPITGKSYFKVGRVTPKYAFVKWNEVGEGKFKRVVEGFIKGCGDKDPYSQTRYSFWRPVVEG